MVENYMNSIQNIIVTYFNTLFVDFINKINFIQLDNIFTNNIFTNFNISNINNATDVINIFIMLIIILLLFLIVRKTFSILFKFIIFNIYLFISFLLWNIILNK